MLTKAPSIVLVANFLQDMPKVPFSFTTPHPDFRTIE